MQGRFYDRPQAQEHLYRAIYLVPLAGSPFGLVNAFAALLSAPLVW